MRLNYSWVLPLHEVGIIHLMLCQLLYKIKPVRIYCKSTRKKWKPHAQRETHTHICPGVYRNTAQLLPVSEVHSHWISCHWPNTKPLQSDHLQHFGPTTSSHLYIQSLLVRPRPGPPITSLFSEHCSSIFNLGRHGEMRSWTSWDPWLQERDQNKESQWEQVPTQLLKHPTILHQRSMCWHFLGWALLSLLQQLENYHGDCDCLSSFQGTGDNWWAQSWPAQPEGAGFSSWDQTSGATHGCTHPAFLQPCSLHRVQESLQLICSVYIYIYIYTHLWPLGGAGHLDVGVESSTGGRAIKIRFCDPWPHVFVPLFVLCLWKVQPCMCSAFSALTDLPAMWIKLSLNSVISNQIKC